jgi:DNA repair protein RadD
MNSPPFELYDYQLDVVARVEEALDAGESPLIVSRTGSGKTIVLAEITKRLVAKHKRVLILAHRREIVHQTKHKLNAHGVRCGAIMAGANNLLRLQEPVQIAMIPTLHARGVRRKSMALPPADVILIDEAHHIVARTYADIIAAFPNAPLIGATATPCRADGRGMGGAFTQLIEAPQVAELTEKGKLVRALVWAPVTEDDKKRILKGVKTRTGDYVVEQLSARMNTNELVGDVVSDYITHGQRRKAICFAVNRAHARHIADELISHGVKAEYLDGDTSIEDREGTLSRLNTGVTEIVVNVAVLTEGFDAPEVGCLILARPTKSLGLYRQMIGRALRIAPDKKDAIILDHSGSVHDHGLPSDRIDWTLSPDLRAHNPVQAARKRGDAPKLHECPSCKALKLGGMACGNCGWEPKQHGQRVDFADGELGLVIGGKAQRRQMSRDEQLTFYRELRGFARRRNMKKPDEWAFYQCLNHKGFKAPWSWRDYQPLAPTPAVESWGKSRLIAFAQRKAVA